MSDQKTSYGESIILGVNRALFAFVFALILSFAIALLINLKFYQEIIALTIGGLGEAAHTNMVTILRTTGLIFGLSTFQVSGRFQIGLLVFGLIPLISFAFSILLFSAQKRKQGKADLRIIALTNGFAAVVFAILSWILAFITEGELFGLSIHFATLRNFAFVLLLTLLVQWVVSINRFRQFYQVSHGIMAIRNLLRLVLSFSALTGILTMLYYALPISKSIFKIGGIILLVIPNIAVYLSLLLMGAAPDFEETFNGLTQYLKLDISFLNIPVTIRVLLIAIFILLVFAVLMKIPYKKYWTNLNVFVIGFSLVFVILAVATRFDLGITQGALNLQLSVSPWRVLLAGFALIYLTSVMVAILRKICMEINQNRKKKSSFCGGEIDEDTEALEENRWPDSEEIEEAEEIEEIEASIELAEINIWQELAARPIPKPDEREADDFYSFSKESMRMDKEKKESKESKANKEVKGISEPEEIDALQELPILKPIPDVDIIRPLAESRPEGEESLPPKEVDISLFPRKKPRLQRLIDFSEIEDEPENTEKEDLEQTLVISKPDLEEEIEKTQTYHLKYSQKMEEER